MDSWICHPIPCKTVFFKQYKVGYGFVSLQAKEAKHAAVKKDLMLSNRSNVSSHVGKW